MILIYYWIIFFSIIHLEYTTEFQSWIALEDSINATLS